MPQRKAKNRKWLIAVAFSLLFLGGAAAFLSSPAYAYDFQPGIVNGLCPNNTPGFTTYLVVCMKETFVYSVFRMLEPVSQFAQNLVAALCVAAVAVWGILMATGRQGGGLRQGFVLAVKLSLVPAFAYNLNGFYPDMLDIIDELVAEVSSYLSMSPSLITCTFHTPEYSALRVWDNVDCIVHLMVGTLAPFSMSFGLVGFLVSALVSGTMGVFIAIMGFLLIVQLLMALARCLYIFITSYMAFALMVLVSPFFVPLIMFSVTRPYFDRWMHLTLSFMMQPVFLVVYLTMLLAAFDTIVYSGPNSLANVLVPDVPVSCNSGNYTGWPIGLRLVQAGAYGQSSGQSKSFNFDPNQAMKQLGGMGSVDKGSLDRIAEQIIPGQWDKPSGQPNDIYSAFLEPASYFKSDVPVTKVSWEWLACLNGYDPNTSAGVTGYLISLFLSFLMALVTAYIFMSLLEFLPYIGAHMGHGSADTGGLPVPGGQIFNSLKGMMSK